MLVVSRNLGESVSVGGVINFVVLGISKGRVKIGIEAPQDYYIARTELLDDEPLYSAGKRLSVQLGNLLED